MRQAQVGALSTSCLICGLRGSADAILNIALFIPLGLVLGGGRGRIAVSVAAGLLTSLVIELDQLFLPGRHASAADLLWNTLGAGLGAMLYRLIHASVLKGSRVRGSLWTAAVVVCLLIAGLLSEPAPTEAEYWGHWAPEFGSMSHYSGSVVSAVLNGTPLASGRLTHEEPHARVLDDPWALSATIVVGSPPPGLSPILSLSDRWQREVLFLGAVGEDLVFRERRVAARLRLDAPDIRATGTFGSYAEGDTVAIGVYRSNGRTCLWLELDEWCGVGTTPGRTWGYLLYLEGTSEAFRGIVDFLWLAGLFIGIGLFSNSSRDAAIGLVVGLGAMGLAIALTPLVPGPISDGFGAAAGVATGRALLLVLRHPQLLANSQSLAAGGGG
jgi:hypothetical protein